MPKLKLITFGCQANELDSARIAGLLARDGYELTDDETEADLVILNGCSIRDKAAQKLFSRLGTLRALKARRPGLRLGIAGCLAQHEGAAILDRFPYVDLVVGNGEHLAAIPRLLAEGLRGPAVALDEPTGFFPEDAEVVRDSAVQAWVGIMEGCDNFCAYCVVPLTRGRERSRHPDDILREVSALRDRGYREITLLGQTVDSYGKKLSPPVLFPELLRRLDAEVGRTMRIRFATSHPCDVTPDLAAAMAELPGVCEHIHLPVQSGADRTLARMARGYTRQAYLDGIAMLRRAVPELAVTTDFIVGFPGETESEFQDTLSLMDTVRFDGAFAFKFSPRTGTPAADFPDPLSDAVSGDRLERLLALQRTHSAERNRALHGRTVEVLVDHALRKRESPLQAGRTRQNKIVHFATTRTVPEGALANVAISDSTAHHLKGVLTASP
jgi:tRNA-2-methylthio-N6-dimethylallyladenosine synthase